MHSPPLPPAFLPAETARSINRSTPNPAAAAAAAAAEVTAAEAAAAAISGVPAATTGWDVAICAGGMSALETAFAMLLEPANRDGAGGDWVVRVVFGRSC